MTKPPVTIRFQSTLYTVNGWLILPVPEDASTTLPSRGQVYVNATVNGHEFQTVLEPDGRWKHWVHVTDDLGRTLGVKSGDTVKVEMTTRSGWPEPTVPDDLTAALASAPQKVKDKWPDITPMARWEWVRWINATANDATRAIRIEKTISKLNGKHRRPCCFNIAACTQPAVAKSGRLIEAS